jgi:hypothetical protein
MEHYNRASATPKSVRIEAIIEKNILSTTKSQLIQQKILESLKGKILIFFLK